MRRYLFLLAALSCLAAGCIRPALPPLKDFNIKALETSALKGKTIVIDPGHGGPERGALAQNGLSEAEVNLGVSLYLWGFLKEAGANPILTRSSDNSLFQGQPFALRPDLEARASVGNSRAADVFLSIHHNSDGRKKGKRNDLIVFYKLSDTGSSRDVARDICPALQQQLQAERASVQPGNYLVLRESGSAAILGEASYMNYKKNSEKLVYHRTLLTEAQGYFLGLLAYFRKGVPALVYTTPAGSIFSTAQPVIYARASAGAPGATLDPATLKAALDGRSAGKPALDSAAGALSFTPAEPLANGSHTLCLNIRNSNGNAANQECLDFTVSLPPASLAIQPVFPTIPADGQSETPLDINVLDGLGRPVLDGTKVRLSASAGTFIDNQTLSLKSGKARVFLQASPEPQTSRIEAAAGSVRATCRVQFGAPPQALFAAVVRDADAFPVQGAVLIRAGRAVAQTDEHGRVFDHGPAGAVQYRLSRNGYEQAGLSAMLITGKITHGIATMKKIDGGVFFGRTVMLDAGDSSETAQSILRELKSMIENAGGAAPLSGETVPAPSNQERVLKAAHLRADFFLSLSGGKKPAAHYYYKSTPGSAVAAVICTSLNQKRAFGKKTCATAPGADYVLMHTSMPALLVRVPAQLKIPPAEAAACLYDGLAGFFQNP